MKIFWDVETTGLLTNSEDPKNQPHMVEFAAIKTDDELNEVARLEFLCKPPILLTPELIKIHNITNEMLADQKPFQAYYKELCEFFIGVKTMVAHNLPFDLGVLFYELKRLNKHHAFPWPYIHECTMQMSEGEESRKLGNLHIKYFGEPIPDAHRAMADVEALIKIYGRMM